MINLLASALVISLVVAAPAAAGVTGEVVEWGITSGTRAPEPATPEPGEVGLAPARRVSGIQFLQRTDVIEARLCRSFGMSVRLGGVPADELPAQAEVRVAHPPMTRPDGVRGSEGRFRSDVIDGTVYAGFSFDYLWEMEPGQWTFTVIVGGTEIARRHFTVTPPPPGAPRSECPAETVS